MIANKYKIIEGLGSGSFGSIFKAENIRTNELVAIKMELLSSETKLLKNETKIYQYLSSFSSNVGIVKVKWFGIHANCYCMAINLLGVSLKEYKQHSDFHFSLEQVVGLTKQMIELLKYIHSKGLIHRDIKPENFLFGLGDKRETLHLIDFGFCKTYLQNDNTHIPINSITKKSIIGSPNYISLNIHNGIEPTRRDDLESISYIIIYLLSRDKEIIWNNNDLESIKQMKTKLFANYDAPEFVKTYLEYCRGLHFNEEPNYNYLYSLLL